MKLKFSLSRKLQIYIIGITAFVLIFSIYFISKRIEDKSIINAKMYSKELASRYALEVEKKLNCDLQIIRTLSYATRITENMSQEEWKPLFANIYTKVLERNPQFDDIWDSWELNKYDSNWEKDYGRYCITAYNKENGIELKTELKSLEGDSEDYAVLKEKNGEDISEPYLFSFTGKVEDEELITGLCVPMQDKNGAYLGVVSADISLTKIQEIINQITPYEDAKSYLISNQGFYTAHPNPEMIGKSIQEEYDSENLIFKIQSGKHFSFMETDENEQESFHIFSPINIGNTNTPWSICIEIPINSITSEARKESRTYLLFGIGILLLISIVIAFVARTITRPLRRITKTLNHLSEGKVDKELVQKYNTGDEIEAISIGVNKTIDGLIDKTKFAKKIGKKEYDIDLKLLSDDDVLGHSLLNMRDSIVKAQEIENERLKEDQKRQWANEGLAEFADIFRQNSHSLEKISAAFTKALIKHNQANQASLFLKTKETFSAVATFAYDHNRLNKSEIAPGEGLVGACIVEKKPTYITDIPQSYINISSGLGKASPNALFICPIQTDKEVLGAFEIASFNEIEKHQRDFIETVCSNFASVVNSIKINETTKNLLQQTRQQTKEMKAQEEEMQQNLEEMTTQEEMMRLNMEEFEEIQTEANKKGEAINSLLDALKSSNYIVEYTTDGQVIEINDSYLEFLQISKEEALSLSQKDHLSNNENNKNPLFWDNLAEGKSWKGKHLLEINGQSFILLESYSPIKNEVGEVVKIIKIANNIEDFTTV